MAIQGLANTPLGTRYSLGTLEQLISKKADGLSVRTVTIQDWPRFKYRGVLEGGGEIWPHEDRMALMPFLEDWKMNSFIYAGKGDPNFRRKWRSSIQRMNSSASRKRWTWPRHMA